MDFELAKYYCIHICYMDMYEISSSFYFFKKCSSVLQYFRVLLEYYFSVLRSIEKAKMPVLNTPEYSGVFTKYSSSTQAFQYSTPRVEYIVNTPVLYSSTDSQYSCLPLMYVHIITLKNLSIFDISKQVEFSKKKNAHLC